MSNYVVMILFQAPVIVVSEQKSQPPYPLI